MRRWLCVLSAVNGFYLSVLMGARAEVVYTLPTCSVFVAGTWCLPCDQQQALHPKRCMSRCHCDHLR